MENWNIYKYDKTRNKITEEYYGESGGISMIIRSTYDSGNRIKEKHIEILDEEEVYFDKKNEASHIIYEYGSLEIKSN